MLSGFGHSHFQYNEVGYLSSQSTVRKHTAYLLMSYLPLFSALPYMLKYTLRTWGLSVTLQIESGLVATTVICGIIFKPLIPKPTNQSQSTTEAEEAKRR